MDGSFIGRLVEMELPIIGEELAVETTEQLLVLRIGAGFEIQAEGKAEIVSEGGAVCGYAGEADSVDVRSLLTGAVVSAAVSSTGALRIEVESGCRLVVPADPDFEAWSLVGPGGYRVVCMPGGELAVWTASGS